LLVGFVKFDVEHVEDEGEGDVELNEEADERHGASCNQTKHLNKEANAWVDL
jgi:hypothetical protein